MNFEQLEYFITLVEEKNFLDASYKLYISQSTLSKNIQKLEKELGISLFDRSSRKAVLTNIGKEFYNRSKLLLNQYYETLEMVNSYKNKNSIRVGVLPIFSQYNLELYFQNFQKNFSNIELIIEEAEEKDLKRKLKENQYDFVIARDLTIDDEEIVKCKIIAKDIIGVIAPKNDSISNYDKITIKDLKDKKLILMNKYTTVYNRIIMAFDKEKITPNIVRTGRPESFINSLSIMNCITILPYKSFLNLKTTELKFIPIFPEIDVSVILMKNKENTLSNNMKIFLEFLTREL